MWPLITHNAAASCKQEVLKAASDWMEHPPPLHMLSGFCKVELRMANGRKGDFFFLIRSNPSLCRDTLQETFSLLCPNRCMRSGCLVFRNGMNWLLHSGIAVHKSLNEFIKSKDDNQSLELPTFLKIKFCSLSSF